MQQERKIVVYKIGEYVICGNKGVCMVEDITTLTMPGVDKAREYYILKPVYMTGSTVYVPADSPRDTMRSVLNREEAMQLIGIIPEISPITTANDKLLEQEYRNCLRTTRCEEWVKIIKTIYLRKQKRLEAGRKVTAVDTKYYRLAEDNLYGELAISFDMPRDEVEAYITEEMDKHENTPLHS